MANKIAGKLINLYCRYYAITGGQYWPVVCVRNSGLTLQKTSIDATSNCGQDTVPGSDDDSMEIEVLYTAQPKDAGVLDANDMHTIYAAEAIAEFKYADDADTPVNFGFAFEGRVLSWAAAADATDLLTASMTIEPKGGITKLI